MDSEEIGPGIAPAPRKPILELPDPFARMKRDRMIYWQRMKDAEKAHDVATYNIEKSLYEDLTARLARHGEV